MVEVEVVNYEELQIYLLKWMGWEERGTDDWRQYGPDGGLLEKTHYPPDYTGDLNAMHEAEKRLDHNQWSSYLDALDRICVPVHVCPTTHSMAVICATAMERAQALVETVEAKRSTLA